jgi:antitoxin (DNA-binding transcriptional repressor) of toxin-antitoxin stability system
VTRKITQRELRNEMPAIMRAIEDGEQFILTRNGTPIADLIPHARPHAEPRGMTGAELMEAARTLPKIDAAEFFADIDRYVDTDPFRGPGEPERTEESR